MKKTKRRIDVLIAARNKVNKKISQYQDRCKHPAKYRTYSYGADTGNWCPGDDSYWITFHCSRCERSWSVDSTEEGYRNPVGTKVEKKY